MDVGTHERYERGSNSWERAPCWLDFDHAKEGHFWCDFDDYKIKFDEKKRWKSVQTGSFITDLQGLRDIHACILPSEAFS